MGREHISFSDRNSVLVMNVPAKLDNDHLAGLPGTTLRFMNQFQAAGLVVDASHMQCFESCFAETIMEIADRVDRMGKRMVIAGMRPVVSSSAQRYGLDFDRVLSTMYIDIALDLIEAIKSHKG